MNMRKTLKL